MYPISAYVACKERQGHHEDVIMGFQRKSMLGVMREVGKIRRTIEIRALEMMYLINTATEPQRVWPLQMTPKMVAIAVITWLVMLTIDYMKRKHSRTAAKQTARFIVSMAVLNTMMQYQPGTTSAMMWISMQARMMMGAWMGSNRLQHRGMLGQGTGHCRYMEARAGG